MKKIRPYIAVVGLIDGPWAAVVVAAAEAAARRAWLNIKCLSRKWALMLQR
jgi:hypothetical protein